MIDPYCSRLQIFCTRRCDWSSNRARTQKKVELGGCPACEQICPRCETSLTELRRLQLGAFFSTLGSPFPSARVMLLPLPLCYFARGALCRLGRSRPCFIAALTCSLKKGLKAPAPNCRGPVASTANLRNSMSAPPRGARASPRSTQSRYIRPLASLQHSALFYLKSR